MSNEMRLPDSSVVIDGVDTYNVPEPLFECVRVVLAHRGEPYTTDYIQGISGAAFRISGICPCAPTCSSAVQTEELAERLGFEAEVISCEDGAWERGETNVAGRLARMAADGVLPGADKITDPECSALRRRLQELIEQTEAEVHRGRPVIFWHAFSTAEFDVVCGYDSEKGLLLGRSSGQADTKEYAEAPETRAIGAALVGGWPKAILIGERVREFDARTAEMSALKEAVLHGLGERDNTGIEGAQWRMLDGVACYDRWANEFLTQPDRTRGMGDSYCYGIYRRTHRCAAGFLREIAPGYPVATDHLNAASESFEKEADTLDSAEDLLGWSAPATPDPERNRKTAAILVQARDHYAAGISKIQAALASIT